jgi:hypothetical protein
MFCSGKKLFGITTQGIYVPTKLLHGQSNGIIFRFVQIDPAPSICKQRGN